MNEPENKKPEISKLAVLGFSLTILGLFLIISSLNNIQSEAFENICAWTIFLSIPAGAALAIIADSRIRRSKGILWGRIFTISSLIIIIGIVAFTFLLICTPRTPDLIICKGHLYSLRSEFRQFAQEHHGKYPDANKWCDEITKFRHSSPGDYFICPTAIKLKDKGPCHYAMNPNCEPNSPNDVVLLFEIKGGWNQHGGQELMDFNSHSVKLDNGILKICPVAFNDSRVEFIKPEDVNKLKWKAEDNNNLKALK